LGDDEHCIKSSGCEGNGFIICNDVVWVKSNRNSREQTLNIICELDIYLQYLSINANVVNLILSIWDIEIDILLDGL